MKNLQLSTHAHHTEQIECPECGLHQIAKVEHTEPWWTYIHECTNCGYLIMESEWIRISIETE